MRCLFHSGRISDLIPIEIKSREKYLAKIIQNKGRPIKLGVFIVGGEVSGGNAVIVQLFVKVMEGETTVSQYCQTEAALDELLEVFRVLLEAKDVAKLR